MAFEGLSDKLNGVFKRLRGKGRLTEADVREGMREVRLALLEADVSYKVVKDFVADVTEKCIGTDVLDSLTPAQQIVKIVNQELTALMGGSNAKLTTASKGPTVVMMVGLQGAGKTTNGAKLAGLMRRQFGRRPLLVACDVYRPAAINQLQVVGKQLDIPVFEEGAGESEADGFGLSGESAALGEGDDVITVFGLEKGKRLLEVEDQGFVGEVFFDGAAIDGDFAFASAHVNAGDGGFATAGSVVFFVSHYHLLLIC